MATVALPREARGGIHNGSDFEHARLRGQATPPGGDVQAAALGSEPRRQISTEAHCERAALEDSDGKSFEQRAEDTNAT